jgi:CubicO group peptidase (beta-lactamase class C family)
MAARADRRTVADVGRYLARKSGFCWSGWMTAIQIIFRSAKAARRHGGDGRDPAAAPVAVMRLLTRALAVAALAATAVGCGDSSPEAGLRYVSYHDPSGGWTAQVPEGWTSVVPGPEFARGEPLSDPTRLLVRTYRDHSPAAALRALAADYDIGAAAPSGEAVGDGVRWQRYRGRHPHAPALAAELAVAQDGADAYVAVLTARRAELGDLRRTALLPALDSFVPGPPDPPDSVLARAPRDPSYWPTTGWPIASPRSQRIDGRRLDEMVAAIRDRNLAIDSVTVIRHGNLVLDQTFGPFAAGSLEPPYAAGRLHELQSATKSVTSMVLGIAAQASGAAAQTPVVRLAAAVDYRPKHLDARKRAMTLEDMLTMQSGLAWKESGHAYEPGSGNDVMKMFEAGDWMAYVLDRPMAAAPGTSFVYNTGTSHLVSGAVTVLTGRTAAEFARKRLFAPVGIRDFGWATDPSGMTIGGFGLALLPRDLAKLAYLYLHQGRWDGRQIVPAAWVERSTTDQVADPLTDYGYLWWLDRADGYAYMAGLYGQLAAVVPDKDLVAVITAHLPATVDATAVTRWLLEKYILPAAD